MKNELVNSEKQSRFFFLQVNAIRLRTYETVFSHNKKCFLSSKSSN